MTDTLPDGVHREGGDAEVHGPDPDLTETRIETSSISFIRKLSKN